MAEKNAESPDLKPPSSPVKVVRARSTFGWIGIRVLAVLLASIWCFSNILYIFLELFIDGYFIQNQLTGLLKNQIGGRVEIRSADFDPLTGLEINEVKIFDPSWQKRTDSRPFLQIKQINIKYKVLALLLGKVDFHGIQIVSPRINLVKHDGVFIAVKSILAYRKKIFGEQSNKSPGSTVVTEDKNKSSALPFDPRFLVLPFHLHIEKIGIFDISATIVEHDTAQKLQKKIHFGGLNFYSGVDWQLNKSKIYLNIFHNKSEHLILNIDDLIDKESSLDLSLGLDLNVVIENLSSINLKTNMILNHLKSLDYNLDNVPVHFSGTLSLFENLAGINLADFQFEFAKIMRHQLDGDIKWPYGNLETLSVDLEQSLELNLEKLNKILEALKLNFKTQGAINLESLVIKGDVDLNRIDEIKNNANLPYIGMRLNIDEIGLVDLNSNMRMQGLSGFIGFSTSPDLKSSGTQFDLDIDLDIDKLNAHQSSPKIGNIASSIENTMIKMTARSAYPRKDIPLFRLNIDVDSIKASGPKIGYIDKKFSLKSTGLFEFAEKNLNFDLQSNIDDLFSIDTSFECEQECLKNYLQLGLNIYSLEGVKDLAMPIAESLGFGQHIPEQLTGSISVHANADSTIPDLKNLNVNTILNHSKIKHRTRLEVKDFSLKYDPVPISLVDSHVELQIDGDMKQIKTKLRKSFSKLKIQKKSLSETPIEISDFDYYFSTNHNIGSEIDLKKPLKSIDSDLKTRLSIGRVSRIKPLMKSVDNIQFNLAAAQFGERRIKVKKLGLEVASLGVNLELSSDIQAKESLLAEMKPYQTTTQLGFVLDHFSAQKILEGLETSGSMRFETSVETKGLESLALSGNVQMKDFNLSLDKNTNEQGAASENLIRISDISGDLPFKQKVDLSKILNQGDNVKESSKDQMSHIKDYLERKKDHTKTEVNPVALVDYSTSRSLINERKPLYIRAVEAANLMFKDIEFDMEIKQNWFSLNQIIVGFLGGRIHGDLKVGFDPIPKSINTAFHLTKLNTYKLLDAYPHLKEKYAGSFDESPYLDGTLHLKYSLAENDLQGGFEITSIGKEQLRMILTFIDPEEKDPAIRNIKNAIRLGNLDGVSVPIKNGYIDIEVFVSLLGASLPIPKISNFPVGQLIGNILNTQAKE